MQFHHVKFGLDLSPRRHFIARGALQGGGNSNLQISTDWKAA
jgi:hypothetical protein